MTFDWDFLNLCIVKGHTCGVGREPGWARMYLLAITDTPLSPQASHLVSALLLMAHLPAPS